MKPSNKIFLIILFLVGSIATNAQARSAMCRIYPLWKDEKVRGSYSDDIGNFKLDGKEGVTIKSFKYKDELFITAGVDFVFDYSKKPQYPFEIRLAIAASNKEVEEVFEMPDSSEAKTLYKKNWNLAVTKNVKIKDVTYMITISCSDGLKLPRK